MKSNPFFKSFAIILSASLSALIFSGCSEGAGWESSQANSSTPTASVPAISSTPTSETPSAPEESKPVGEPTFLIGLDGKAILTSEITRLENTDKTAETLTKDDLSADIFCDGFAYYKEPLGVGYNSYKNPEMFDGFRFIGEVPENNNEWKRVYVGDEICGLKVKAASVGFSVSERENYKINERYIRENENRIELEGTIEAEGFLEVNNNSVQYPDTNGLMWFYPTSINLPIVPSSDNLVWEKGFTRFFGATGTYNHNSEFTTYGEFRYVDLGNINDAACDMNGIGTGDISYARVTLSNIGVGGNIGATLESVELLSDILAHTEDDTIGGGTMGRD